MRKLVSIRLGLHGIPSVQRLMPEVASSYTKTFPLTISELRSRSWGRRKQWANVPRKHASNIIRASLVVSMWPFHVGRHWGAFPLFIALPSQLAAEQTSPVDEQGGERRLEEHWATASTTLRGWEEARLQRSEPLTGTEKRSFLQSSAGELSFGGSNVCAVWNLEEYLFSFSFIFCLRFLFFLFSVPPSNESARSWDFGSNVSSWAEGSNRE